MWCVTQWVENVSLESASINSWSLACGYRYIDMSQLLVFTQLKGAFMFGGRKAISFQCFTVLCLPCYIRCALIALGSVILWSTNATAQRSDVLRGHVTTDSGIAIPSADVIVTVAPSAEVIRTTSISDGSFSLALIPSSGEYIIFVGAVGFKSFRQRITRVGAADTTFIINPRLSAAVSALGTVRVEARRSRPRRSLDGDPTGAGVTGVDKTADGIVGAVAPDLAGDINAIALTVPGLTPSADGVTAFGMPGTANSTTINGLSFTGVGIPRDVQAKMRFSTSPWDPAKGSFAGVLSTIDVARGDNISTRTGHVTLDMPTASIASRGVVGQRLGGTISEGGTGALLLDRLYYNVGMTVSRRVSDVPSLISASTSDLVQNGVAPDSAARFLRILDALHIPTTARGAPANPSNTSGSLLGRLDYIPLQTASDGAAPGPRWSLLGYGRYSLTQSELLSALAPPAAAGRAVESAASLQMLHSAFYGPKGGYLNETSVGVTGSERHAAPYQDLPAGAVTVASVLPDNSPALETLRWGSNGLLTGRMRRWQIQAVNQTSFFPTGSSTLPLKVYAESRLESYRQTPAIDRYGTIGYSSLADLEANRPSSLSVTSNVSDRSGGQWMGAAAMGGSWIRGNVTWTGGVRIDASRFTSAPAENAAVFDAFNEHTGRAPTFMGASPRLGFTWRYQGTSGFSSAGTDLAVINKGSAQLRGGVGKFQSLYPTTLLSDAMAATGIAGRSPTQVECVGAAIPVPDWDVFSSRQSTSQLSCTQSELFADSAPNVMLFDRHYQPLQSWRATLGWTSTIKNTYFAIDGTYSLTLNAPSLIDVNFTGVPRFHLPSEGNRPVFVPATAIVSNSGALVAASARLHPEFGNLLAMASDLRGEARQVTVYAIPPLPASLGVFTVGYTFANTRVQARGADQSTADDPRTIEWSRDGFTPRHQLLLQGAHEFSKVGITTFMRIASGVPFTPVVAGDVNGDGLAADRAFVFDPLSTSDTALATGLNSLLHSRDGAVRNCLLRQIGHIARRNGCDGGWSALINANLFVVPPIPGTAGRARLSFALSNVLAGLDMLLHGSANSRGWGMSSAPDPVLYQIRGFDARTPSVLYRVNPHFGRSGGDISRLSTPFRISLDVTIDLGREPEKQQLVQNLRIQPRMVGTRALPDSIKRRFMDRNFTDVYGVLLQMGDSLALSRHQAEEMDAPREALIAAVDSTYDDLARYLAALPDNYDQSVALKRVRAANDAVWSRVYAQRSILLRILTPGQLRLLPRSVFRMLTDLNFHERFYFG